MRGFGLREGVGLGVLAVALVIGFLFIDPSASESQGSEPGGIHLGDTPTATPQPPPPTATPEPVHVLTAPNNWVIQFYEVPSSGGELANGNGVAQSLDMTYAGAPFPDFHDDRWFVRATAGFTLQAGLSKLTIQHDGDIRVLVDDVEVGSDADGPAPKTAEITFRHAAGPVSIEIEAHDSGGPFRLKFGE